jgi:hypothetical protein
MSPNKVINYLTVAFCCFVIIGCAQPSIRMQVEGLTPEEISTIKSEDKRVSIVGIDGQPTVGRMKFLFYHGKWAGKASLRPGEHTFFILYDDGHIKSRYSYGLDTRPGGVYTIRQQVTNRSAFLWLEDAATGKSVGKVITSMNEPITDRNAVLDHSVYFTMRPPTEEGWVIACRNNRQTALIKEGSSMDETYAMNVILVELPNLNSREEFMSFVKEGRRRGTDSKRFNIITDDLAYFDGRKDYCLNYHSVVEDKEAVKRSGNKGTMILEMVGYVCRHPGNKNIGINFDYSQRYYAGHRDNNLADKAREDFKLVEF